MQERIAGDVHGVVVFSKNLVWMGDASQNSVAQFIPELKTNNQL